MLLLLWDIVKLSIDQDIKKSQGVASCTGRTGGSVFAELVNTARLTLKSVCALFTTTENTASLLELGHAHSRQSGGCVVLGLVVVDLVDGDGGVCNVGFNDLLVDDGLDCFVNVVVYAFCADGRFLLCRV